MYAMISKGKQNTQDGQHLLQLRWCCKKVVSIILLLCTKIRYLRWHQSFHKLASEEEITRYKSIKPDAFSSQEVKDLVITHKILAERRKSFYNTQQSSLIENATQTPIHATQSRKHEVHVAIYFVTTAVIKQGRDSKESHRGSSVSLVSFLSKSIVNTYLISTENLSIIPEIQSLPVKDSKTISSSHFNR